MKAVSACAVSVLAMVFSVQQGEHGPLVVYKLQVPRGSAPAAAAPPGPIPAPVPAPRALAEEPVYVVPSRAPKVLGRVVMPPTALLPREAPAIPAQPSLLESAALPAEVALETEEAAAGAVLRVPDRATVLRIIEDAPLSEAMINEETGGVLTLKHVNDALTWRHDTAEKLRRIPAAPRF